MKRTLQAAIAAAAIATAPATAFGAPAFATDSDSSTATSWFSRSAEDAARSKAGDTFGSRYDVKVGAPTHASVFAGDKDDLRVTGSEYWAAPVKSGDKVLGTIAVKVTDGKVGTPIFTAEEAFGKELANRTPNTTVVVDPLTQGWFLLTQDGHVRPLDPRARKVVAGQLTLREFASVRDSLRDAASGHSSSAAKKAARRQGDSTVLKIVVAGLILLFGALGAAVWIRRALVKRRAGASEPVGEGRGADRSGGQRPSREGLRAATSSRSGQSNDGSRTIRFDTGEIVRVYEMPPSRGEGRDGGER